MHCSGIWTSWDLVYLCDTYMNYSKRDVLKISVELSSSSVDSAPHYDRFGLRVSELQHGLSIIALFINWKIALFIVIYRVTALSLMSSLPLQTTTRHLLSEQSRPPLSRIFFQVTGPYHNSTKRKKSRLDSVMSSTSWGDGALHRWMMSMPPSTSPWTSSTSRRWRRRWSRRSQNQFANTVADDAAAVRIRIQ